MCFLLYLVEELILGWLPPFKLLMGFRSPNRLLLLRGFTIVLDEADRSFRRPFVRSFDKSLIFVNAPRGFSGGRLEENKMRCETIRILSRVHLVALDEVTEAFAKEVLDALVESELARLVRDVDRPVDNRSKTFEPEDL